MQHLLKIFHCLVLCVFIEWRYFIVLFDVGFIITQLVLHLSRIIRPSPVATRPVDFVGCLFDMIHTSQSDRLVNPHRRRPWVKWDIRQVFPCTILHNGRQWYRRTTYLQWQTDLFAI